MGKAKLFLVGLIVFLMAVIDFRIFFMSFISDLVLGCALFALLVFWSKSDESNK